MNDHVASVAEVVGAASIVAGASMLSTALGFIVGGVFGLLFARSISR